MSSLYSFGTLPRDTETPEAGQESAQTEGVYVIAGTVVELCPVEQRLAKHIASERERINRASGVSNGRIGPQSDAETDLTGIGAELAFCRLMNVYPDLTLDLRAGGEDCWWAGRSVDVKGTRYPTGKLLAVPTKLNRDGAEVYALMTGTFPTYTFRGLAAKDALLRADRLTDLGHGSGYAMTQEELA